MYIRKFTSRKLNACLADINEQTEGIFSRLVKQRVERESVTEQLKASSQMAWTGKINNLRACLKIVKVNLIFVHDNSFLYSVN
ncbi:MAG: TnpV protein [Ruminococcus sp.]|nr:TnpV protein [Ruminococcus sp.]